MFNDVTSSYDSSDASWEIIIMLLIAFLLGFILRHLFGCKSESKQDARPQVQKKTRTIKTEPKPKRLTRVELAVREMKRGSKKSTVVTPQVKRLTGVELAVREMERENKRRAVAAPVSALKVEAKQPSKPESLQQVEGIGPKIEGLLHTGGFLTMRELATADLDLVQDILTAAGPRYTMHSPKTWAAQAELIADEKWDALKEYQDFLVGGREPES